MKKQVIETIHEKNMIVDNIIDAFQTKENFLILGHKNPDEDCIAAMVGFALIVSKFSKKASVYISENVHEHFQYLINICAHNAIGCTDETGMLRNSIDAIVVCDTPKPSMIDAVDEMLRLFTNKDILKIEIDHHIGADSQYIGDDGYCLVTEANSSSELVGLIALKLTKKKDILRRYHIQSPLSRNVVLAVLTGIIGDTNMGLYIKSRRQKRFYDIFSNLYNMVLMRETTKKTNFMNKDEVFHEIQRLSAGEAHCFEYMVSKKKFSSSIEYVILDKKDMDCLTAEFDNDTIVSVSRSIADYLAEESTRMGLVAYDDTDFSNLIQFRLRRGQGYRAFDLRKVLEICSIEDGGGHEGAIAFRVPSAQINDINEFVADLITCIEKTIPA